MIKIMNLYYRVERGKKEKNGYVCVKCFEKRTAYVLYMGEVFRKCGIDGLAPKSVAGRQDRLLLNMIVAIKLELTCTCSHLIYKR